MWTGVGGGADGGGMEWGVLGWDVKMAWGWGWGEEGMECGGGARRSRICSGEITSCGEIAGADFGLGRGTVISAALGAAIGVACVPAFCFLLLRAESGRGDAVRAERVEEVEELAKQAGGLMASSIEGSKGCAASEPPPFCSKRAWRRETGR